MREFADHGRKIYSDAAQLIETLQRETSRLVDEIEEADSKFSEQDTIIASQQETIELLKAENERVVADFQVKIDAMEQEITALRSRLGQKDKDFGILSRGIKAMIVGARQINAVGMHATKVIEGDAMADKIVTRMRGRPERAETTIFHQPGEPEQASAG